ncbi:MAG: dienelactone hydrolase family protein [Nannocystaceae bacterium]
MDRQELSIPGAVAPGYYVSPPQPRGAVVVIHEIFGRAPDIERACDRLAAGGYAALMPDLFGDRLKPLCVARSIRQIARGHGPEIDVICRAGDVLAERSGIARERVGVIGFCLGGGFALAVGKAFAATSSNYGQPPDRQVMAGIGPTIACFGARDRSTSAAVVKLRTSLAELGVPHEVHVLNAGHAFLTDGHRPIAEFLTRPLLAVDAQRDREAREDGWRRIFAFFDQHLAT